MPNPQWDDFALDREFREIERRMDAYEDSLKGIAAFPIRVAEAALNIEHLSEEMHRLSTEMQNWRDDRRKGRTAIVVAVISASATVMAALVVLIAQLAGGG